MKNPKYLQIEAYLGGDSQTPEDFPLRNGDLVSMIIDLDTKTVVDWPKGLDNFFYEKVVDRGAYYLISEEGNIVSTIEQDYVPKCVPHYYDDYIDIEVGPDGIVTNWTSTKDEIIAEFSEKGKK